VITNAAKAILKAVAVFSLDNVAKVVAQFHVPFLKRFAVQDLLSAVQAC